MKGRSPIVLRIENHGFFEHPDQASVEREAERLVMQVGGTCVVYVPVMVVKPAPRVVTERLVEFDEDDDGRPF